MVVWPEPLNIYWSRNLATILSQEPPEHPLTETPISAQANNPAVACPDDRNVVASSMNREGTGDRQGDYHRRNNGFPHDRRRITHILVREN